MDFEGLHVLVADDNAFMRQLICGVLRGLGVRDICEAASGAEALLHLKSFAADVAMVDYRMSPVNGIRFTHAVRNGSDSPNRYLPIILCTGYSDERRMLEARDVGVSEIIAKPISTQAVIDRLRAVIVNPRPFVRTDNYFGPCRRRLAGTSFAGLNRRKGAASTDLDLDLDAPPEAKPRKVKILSA